jgi:hypothetical protein
MGLLPEVMYFAEIPGAIKGWDKRCLSSTLSAVVLTSFDLRVRIAGSSSWSLKTCHITEDRNQQESRPNEIRIQFYLHCIRCLSHPAFFIIRFLDLMARGFDLACELHPVL